MMIPPDRIAAVTRGLRAGLGVTEFEEVRELTGGPAANQVFRIAVQGASFLLRINTRLGDVTRQYTCMKSAAEAGLAPRVRYVSVEDRLSITDFVEAVPFPAKSALVEIPRALRKLHALTPFPAQAPHLNTTWTFLLNKGPAVEGFLEKVKTASVLPEDKSEEFFARYAELTSIYPHEDADMVSSHNDLFKPDNILFDGDRMWLVDWEAAFLNDRYADLAVVANLIVSNGAEEELYLREYFGGTPDEYQRARFFLAQQAAHMFYAMVFLLFGAAGKSIDWDESAPSFGDIRRSMWDGEMKLTENRTKLIYGRAHWEELLGNLQQARYREALRVVSERYRGA